MAELAIEQDRISPSRSNAACADAPERPENKPPAAWETLLVGLIAGALDALPEDLDTHQPLAELGLGSEEVMQLAEAVTAISGRRLSPVVVFKHPTISALARHLARAEG